jgi:hypothetical protein
MPPPQPAPRPFRGDRRAYLGLALVVALALALRLGRPGLIDFKLDDGTVAQKALDIARGRRFYLDGVWSSRGIPTPPNMDYLLAVPFLFSGSPAVETAYVGLLSVAALGLGYWLAHRYFGTAAATLAMGLFAVSPWPIYFARRPMPFSLLFLPVALVAVSGVLGFVEGRRRWQAVHLVALAFAVETHLSAIALALLTAYLLIVFRRRLDWRMLGLGAAIALVSSAPVWIVVAQQRETIAADLAQPAERTSETLLSPQALEYAIYNTTGLRFYTLAAPQAAPGESPRADDLAPVLWAEAAWLGLSFVGLAAYAWRNRASPTGQVAGILIAWTLAPVAAFTAQWTAVYPHYFIPLMPAPYLVIGAATALGVGWLAAQGRAVGWAGGAVTLALAVIISLAQWSVYSRVMDFFATRFTPGDLGTPLEMKMAAARRAQDLAGTDEIVVVGEGDRDWGYETPAVFDVLLDAVPHRFVTGSQAAVFPAGRAAVLLVPGEWEAANWYAAFAEPQGEMPLRQGEPPYRFYTTLGGFALPGDFQPPESAATVGNGVTVLGFRWLAPLTASAPGRVVIAWQVGPAPDVHTDYHLTLYLQDAGGQVWAQNDGPSFPSDMWRPGDVVLNWLTLGPPAEAPPGPAALKLGMYAFPDIVRVPVVGADGAPVADAVQLATLELQP